MATILSHGVAALALGRVFATERLPLRFWVASVVCGVAFFAPFNNTRFFFPWRPIEVSPIGLSFFSTRGMAVLLSELIWI